MRSAPPENEVLRMDVLAKLIGFKTLTARGKYILIIVRKPNTNGY